MAKAIGMDVIAFDIFHIPGIEEKLGIPYVEMDELLAKSDFISVHAPAVDGGALINAERIAKMKDGVVIINTSRGTNVDEAALLAGLESRQGPRGRSGRLRRRARHQQGALQPSDGLLHAAHRRRDRRSPEAHRRGDRRYHLGVLRQFSVQPPLGRCIIRSKLAKILYGFYDYFSSAT